MDKWINELLSWEGTPYIAGQRLKGIGVDCVGLLCSVMDVMYGYGQVRLPSGKLNPSEVLRLLSRYPHDKKRFPEDGVELGDVFLCGKGDGIGHCYLALDENILIHADGNAVNRSSIAYLSPWKTLLMIRPKKELW